MSKKKLVLMVSTKMDANKKGDRDEHALIRMSAKTREGLGFSDSRVELCPINEDGKGKPIILSIFQSFQSDLDMLREKVAKGTLTEDKTSCIGFVTTKTFKYICGGKEKIADIWISDGISSTVFGTDPEFLLFDRGNGEVISAQYILDKDGEMGCDGAMAEVRPQPATTAEMLVENIRRIFEKNANENSAVSKFSWVSTCFHKDKNRPYPVGGHIHVGNPMQLMEKSAALRGKLYKVMNKILDEYLALPLVVLDGPDGAKRREDDGGIGILKGFGRFGELRTDIGRLEHRTLSGMWLTHPSLSKIVLGTAKAIIDEIFKKVAEHNYENSYVLPATFAGMSLWSPNFDSWNSIPLASDMGCTLPSRVMVDVLTKSPSNYMTAARINELHKKLMNLSTYKDKTNAKYIDGFCEVLKIKHAEFSKFDKEIQTNWLTKKKFIIEV